MYKEILRRAEIFEGLRDEQLDQVVSCCTVKKFRFGDQIHQEGETADHLFLVAAGSVALRFSLPGKLSTDRHTLSRIRENGSFGWSSLIPPARYRLSAYCEAASCELVQISGRELLDYFQHDAGMGLQVMTNLSRVVGTRLHELQADALKPRASAVKITVHMGTCGIAAGARMVMKTLMDEIQTSDRREIEVKTGGCLGRCDTEPNVTVEIEGEDPVTYQKVDAARMHAIFQAHILGGKPRRDMAMTTG
jgi:(2Fe-2S) ferredoxin